MNNNNNSRNAGNFNRNNLFKQAIPLSKAGTNRDSTITAIKTATLAKVKPGDKINYTLTLEDSRAEDPGSAATYIYLTDTLPKGLTLVPDSVTVNGYTKDDNTLNGGLVASSLGKGESISVAYTAQVDGTVGGALSNKGTFTYTDENGNAATLDTNKVEVMMEESGSGEGGEPATITATQTATPTTERPGQDITYTLTLSASGPVNDIPVATSIYFLDMLTKGLTLVPDSVAVDGNFVNDNTLNGSRIIADQLVTGGSITVTFKARVDQGVSGTLSNEAKFSYTDENGKSDFLKTDTVDVTVFDLRATQTATPTTAKPGDVITYTLTLADSGMPGVGSATTSIHLTDTLPQGLTFEDGSLLVNGSPSDEDIFTDTKIADQLVTGGSITVTFKAQVDQGVSGTLSNEATFTYTDKNENFKRKANAANVTVESGEGGETATITATQTATPTTARPGQDITYTLTLSASGTADGIPTATNISLIDPLPQGLTLVQNSVEVDGNTVNDNTLMSGKIADTLKTGDSITVTFTARVDQGVIGTLKNEATFLYTDENGKFDKRDANAANVTVESGEGGETATITARKYAATKSATPGDVIIYALEFAASGTRDTVYAAIDIYLEDTLPQGLTLVKGSVKVNGSQASNETLNGTVMVKKALAKGEKIVVTYEAKVDEGVNGTLSNSAIFSYKDEKGYAKIETNTVDVTVVNLKAYKKADKAEVKHGDVINYSMRLDSMTPPDGNSAVTTVLFSDILKEGLTLVDGSVKVNETPVDNNTLNDGKIADALKTGETIAVYFAAKVDKNASGVIDNTAGFAYIDPAGNQAYTNTNTVNVTVENSGGEAGTITATKYANITNVKPSDVITYTLYLTTSGTEGSITAATNVKLSDPLPTGLSLVPKSIMVDGITVDDNTLNGGMITTTLKTGEVIFVKYQAQVNKDANGTLSNKARFSYIDPDGNQAYTNTNTVNVTVENSGGEAGTITATQTANPTTAEPGEEITYTLTLADSGTSDGSTAATDVNLTDTLPQGLTYVDGSLFVNGSPSVKDIFNVDGALIANTVLSGSSITVTFKARVNQEESGTLSNKDTGDTLSNKASFSYTARDGSKVKLQTNAADVTVDDGECQNWGNRAYLSYANMSSSNVPVINTDTMSTINSMTINGEAGTQALDSVRGLLYVTNNTNKTIDVIQVATGKIVDTIANPDGNNFDTPTVDEATGKVYVGTKGKKMLVYDPSIGAAETFDMPDYCVKIAVNSDTNTIYYLGENGLHVVDGASGTIDTLNGNANDIAVDSKTGYIFLATENGIEVLNADLSDNTTIGIGNAYMNLAIDENEGVLYAVNSTVATGEDGESLNKLERINIQSLSENGSTTIPHGLHAQIAVDKATGKVIIPTATIGADSSLTVINADGTKSDIALSGFITGIATGRVCLDPPAEGDGITLLMAKNALGAGLEGGEFEFGLYDKDKNLIATATNGKDGLITFKDLKVDATNDYDYTIKEITAADGWDADTTEYPVHISVDKDGKATVDYPDGTPSFKNRTQSETCGLIEFPELTFDAPGDYEFDLKELTKSGNGWITDSTVHRVIVHVVEDDYGNLVATAEYQDGFPHFVNKYGKVARITLSACKIAIGKELTGNEFEFGIFEVDKDGVTSDVPMETTVRNGPAKQTYEGKTPSVDVSKPPKKWATGVPSVGVTSANGSKSRKIPCNACAEAAAQRLSQMKPNPGKHYWVSGNQK
jgi:uncharacterized repeat protein (TIGR01451 family)/pilin isopeptide linkage protein